MTKISLKNIIGRKNDASALINSLLTHLKARIFIEDENGKILLGEPSSEPLQEQHLIFNHEILGSVKGDANVQVIANLVLHLLEKEAEKKKLGSEVLNLYQEVNLIFNFSEKLSQTIEPLAISQITLDEASHLIRSDNGVVVLWDENSKRMQVMASSGELFFNQEKINSNMSLLLKILLSGQSEIIGDISSLADAGIILPGIQSVLFAALKVNHRIMGAIILARNESNQYTAADLKLLTNLALQSSSSIESALLYEKNIREAKEKEEAMRRVYEVTAKFVPVEFIQSLGHDVITDVKLGDQVEKIVTVLFSDIREYTTLSEQMTPEQNFSFVCSFNERMGPIIRQHNGFINQYLGDAIMAIFPGHASDALSAAIAMQKEVEQLNKKREANNERSIKIGVGMHTGPLIMGITGDADRMDATTISDTVNTASRLESLTKYYKGNIIISEATLQQIDDPGLFHLRHLGMVQLKGKLAPITIHECFSGNSLEELQKKLDTLAIFNEGILKYQDRNFDNAVSAFQSVLEVHPEDQTSTFFLTNATRYITTGVPSNWMGIEEMQSK
ncbi:MAG: adenylate/guanylate cyclase domain-containing protein [Ginsengibacter sp.]